MTENLQKEAEFQPLVKRPYVGTLTCLYSNVRLDRLLLFILGFSVLPSPFQTMIRTSSTLMWPINTVRSEFWVSKFNT